MQKTALWLFAGLLGLGLAGCSSLKSQDGHGDTQAKPANSSDPATPPQDVKYADFEPEVLYELLTAEIAAQRGRYDVTLVNYVQAAKQSRDTGVIKRAMRIAQSLNGDNAQRQLADLWLETDPDNLEAHRVAAIQAIKRNELQTALDHMEKIMDLGGDADFDSLAAMAANLRPEQQTELLNLYRKLEARHPDNQEIHYSIALLLKITGDQKAALTQLEPLLDHQPDFQPALVLKGDLLYETGQKDAALSFLRTNTRRYPDNRQMGTLYGRILVSEGDLQGAQDEFQRLLERFPDTPGLRLSHALVALENGDTELAREDLTSLIEQGHHTSEAHYYLGRIADQEGDIESAIGYYENVKEGSHFFPALARLSALRADQGELDQALAHIRQLRGKNPSRADNFWLIEINLLVSNDRKEQALEAANTAIKAYP
ncbi:MAG: tetratricopeptide repeat protein, partial [Marinobacter sp.]|nr:tetratricopeptide repeat protein [Marinobacter sp.]